jgi:glycosyltransferase involved in cell wall biosynthesis
LADPVDIALLTSSPTLGWRRADDAFAALLREAGASCAVLRFPIGRAGALRRHPALTDLVEALAARHGAARLPAARAVVVSSVTAALLLRLDLPYAVRFDAPAALNRPGLPGAWQRAVEPRALARASLLLPWSEEAAAPLAATGRPVVPVGVPVERIAPAATRDLDVLAYAGNPDKRGLDDLCAAWAQGLPGTLSIGGIAPERARAWLARRGVAEPPGVRWLGVVARERWLELLSRARVFVNAARFEDHGLAPLEALSAGAALVTTPSPGPYPALRIARALAPELVTADRSPSALAAALRAGLAVGDGARAKYAAAADERLVPHRREAILATVAGEVLPALGVSR